METVMVGDEHHKGVEVCVNPVYLAYLDEQARVQIYFGGASSGKSYFIGQRVVLDVLRGRNYLVVRNVARTIRHSVYNQIVKTIRQMKVERYFGISKAEMAITCLKNGKQILFAGLDDVEKLKSVTPADGVLSDIWIEEATETNYGSYKQLTKRLRGWAGEGIEKRVTLSFNPVTKSHWIYKEFFGRWVEGNQYLRGKDLTILKTTYKDNCFLTGEDKRALEEEKDGYFYQVYTLGNWGVLGKLIFKNWRMENLSSKVSVFDRIRNGLDFGFSEDPDALVRVHVDEKRKIIYLFEEFYCSGMHDDELAEELRKRIGDGYVTCDSSSPKTIDYLCRKGIRAVPAVKGADSILFGIRFLQGYEIVIDVECQNFKREIEQYCWAEDQFGNRMQRPVDRENHLLDALRYAVEDLMLMSRGTAVKRII